MPGEEDRYRGHPLHTTPPQVPKTRSRPRSGRFTLGDPESATSHPSFVRSPMDYSAGGYHTFPTPGQSQFYPVAPALPGSQPEMPYVGGPYDDFPSAYSSTSDYGDQFIDGSMSRKTSQHDASSISNAFPATSANGYHNDGNIIPTPRFIANAAKNLTFSTRTGEMTMTAATSAQQPYRYAPSTGASSRGTQPYDATFSDHGPPSTPRTDPDALNSPGHGYGAQGEVANQMDALNFGGHGYHEVDSSVTQDTAARSQQRQSNGRKREHWCDVEHCPHNRAFGTRNDLERHKLSVHKIASEGQKVYICQGESCLAAGKSKGWPRKDNFKNHCKVAHPDEDADELLRRSESTSSAVSLSPDGICDDIASEAGESKHRDLHVSIPTSNTLTSPPIYLTPTKEEYPSPQRNFLSHQDPRNLSPDYSFARPMKELSAEQQGPTPGRGRDVVFGRPLSEVGYNPDIEREISDAIFKNVSREARNYWNSVRRKRPSVDLVQIGEEEGSQPHYCFTCEKSFSRACDLRKHAERHTKRWGCTSSICNKRFGSKNDWKRHENLVHFQPEIWVCGEKASPDTPPKQGEPRCVFVCSTPKQFVRHLETRHQIFKSQRLEYVQEQENSRRIGSHCAGFMWCGFCENVIPLLKLDAKQWEERFDHIDQHFKQGKSIDDWFSPNSNLPKGQIPLPTSPEPSLMDDFDTSSVSDTSSSGGGVNEDGFPIDPALLVETTAQGLGQRSPKRRAVASISVRQWHCCECGNAVMNSAIDIQCTNCHHRGLDCESCVVSVTPESECDVSMNPCLGNGPF